MATNVPYDPTSSIAPSGGGTPELHPNATPDVFGAGVGDAIKNLGGTVSHLGDELFTRALALQKLSNETVALEADTEYMKAAGKLHAEYNALQGQARVAAFDDYQKNLQTVRLQIRAGLPNDEARRMYDPKSVSTLGHSIFNGAGAAATAQKDWTRKAAQSSIDAEQDNIAANPKDDLAVARGERAIEDKVRTLGDLDGAGDERTKQEVKRALSSSRAGRIVSLARDAPTEAREMLERYRPMMTRADIERAESVVKRQTYTTGARLIAAEENADLYDPDRKEDAKERTLTERVASARAKAEKQFPNDPLAVEAAMSATESSFNKFKQAETQDARQAKETVGNALLGLSNQKGMLPTNMDELRALDPKAADAYDRMKVTDKKSVQAAFTKNAKGDVTETPERRDRYNQLKAMSVTFPAEFLDTDIWKEDIPIQMKQQLQDQKLKVVKGQADDPRVTAAMRQLEPSLRAAGITAQSKDDYLSFKGQLMGAMQAYRDVNQKPPNADEIQKMGSRLLQEKSSPWFGDFWKTKNYALPVPKEAADIIKTDPAWGGVEPTEQQIQQTYMRTQFQKLYGKTKSETAKPPRITPPRE